MRKGRTWQALLILSLLIGLTIYLGSCKTTGRNPADAALAALAPPVPAMPFMEPVFFVDRDGGLWLSYNDYRSMERNVIALREHIEKLEIIIRFYRGE